MVDVTLPSLGESVTEGIITRWFKKVGDAVARDEPLLEVSTDKVDSELPSPAAGVLVQIIAEEGDTVETGSRVGVIDESATAAAPSAQTAPVGASAPTSAPTSAPAAPVAVATTRGVAGLVLSPVVRRILADGLVEASSVRGTGPGGAITRRDAERAVALGPTEEIVVPFTHGQRRMGQHMAASALSAPHGYVAVEVDGTVFERLDEAGRLTRDGVAVADEVMVAVAAVRALGEFEFLNASVDGENLVVHRSVNIGFVRAAVDGMLVPVVHAAAGLTVRALARRVADLEERVSSRQLTADDLMGGTFTMVGPLSEHSLASVPLLIQPQVAVLSMGAVRREAVVVGNGDASNLAVGRRVILGLTFDHRVCEPFAAARYLERVATLLNGLDVESEL
ncbi:MAG: 2-oxo acid dehydrogenase subunit E2 [Acidobacteriota bacterium]|nr:2-oxo acid dehydrogenase subunit E2 [Acidobacteriota bacterium]